MHFYIQNDNNDNNNFIAFLLVIQMYKQIIIYG